MNRDRPGDGDGVVTIKHECNEMCRKYEHCPSCFAHVGPPDNGVERCPVCGEELA